MATHGGGRFPPMQKYTIICKPPNIFFVFCHRMTCYLQPTGPNSRLCTPKWVVSGAKMASFEGLKRPFNKQTKHAGNSS